MRWFIILTVLLGIAIPAEASVQITGLYNTGVDDSGVVLPDASADSHYAITVSPYDPTPLGDQTRTQDPRGYPIPPWLGDNDTSRWIGPNTTHNSMVPQDFTLIKQLLRFLVRIASILLGDGLPTMKAITSNWME